MAQRFIKKTPKTSGIFLTEKNTIVHAPQHLSEGGTHSATAHSADKKPTSAQTTQCFISEYCLTAPESFVNLGVNQ